MIWIICKRRIILRTERRSQSFEHIYGKKKKIIHPGNHLNSRHHGQIAVRAVLRRVRFRGR